MPTQYSFPLQNSAKLRLCRRYTPSSNPSSLTYISPSIILYLHYIISHYSLRFYHSTQLFVTKLRVKLNPFQRHSPSLNPSSFKYISLFIIQTLSSFLLVSDLSFQHNFSSPYLAPNLTYSSVTVLLLNLHHLSCLFS